MAFRLVVADVVDFPVKFTVNDGGASKPFAINLQAKRLPQDAFRRLAEGGSDATVGEFLAEHVTGWRGQKLVVDDAGQPADFSPEAFACLLSLVGVAGLAFAAYLEACGAQGKAKN
jgi:hypothetical protein